METLEIFSTDDGRTFCTVNLKESRDSALTMANSHFKVAKSRLGVKYGWLKKGTLYFKECSGGKKCWVIWRKTNAEL